MAAMQGLKAKEFMMLWKQTANAFRTLEFVWLRKLWIYSDSPRLDVLLLIWLILKYVEHGFGFQAVALRVEIPSQKMSLPF